MTASEDELERRLRTLFADEALQIQPETHAEQAIVAGARRRRHRRQAVLSGLSVTAAAVLVIGGLTVVKVRARDNNAAMTADQLRVSSAQAQPATSESPSLSSALPPPAVPETGARTAPTQEPNESTRVSPKDTPTPVTSPANKVQTGPVLSAYGFGQLKLGMTEADAAKQGATLTKRETSEPCVYYDVSGAGVPPGGSVAISPGNGLVIVVPAMPAHTPEGIGVGSTKDEVLATYPGASDTTSAVAAPAGPTSTYRFALTPAETVERVDLYSVAQDCAG
ncbi:hypothetical protein [Amycolatopsis sp. H20-H5]|uniref:hypothetical protein n=1 Tax=Amycolatopsis sp. H20-H5 TaxID=3046309 RepID=UPI002DB6C610|nr:hypothetical protein [Amycolatopsis sp. H20-H5]MEC3980425.1 hypothetical protein [Amycolatopsis sp. H20-H5]